MENVKHVNVKIYGRVQGVFFRDSAKREADKLSLTGFARNEPDGSVYIEAEGEEEKLKKFLNWCYSGPRWAEVKKIDFEFGGEFKNYRRFEVL